MKQTVPHGWWTQQYRYYGRRIEQHLDLLFRIVERILDCLLSETANMLHLDRFSSWYTDKVPGNSPYENSLERLLFGHVRGHDTISIMNDRYRIIRAYNLLSLAHRSAFPEISDLTKHMDIDARGWNQEAWHCV